VHKADNLPPSCAVVKKSGSLNFLEPFGPVQAYSGTALPLHLPFLRIQILEPEDIYINCLSSNYWCDNLKLLAPCILYIGQTYRYSTEYTFYKFSEQIYVIIFLDFLSPSSFIPLQNVVYFLMLHFLVHRIFTLYINGVLNCKCPAPGSKG